MKKILMATIVATMMMTGSVLAEDTTTTTKKCELGNTFGPEGDNDKFCVSQMNLNWWSAATWCKAQGRKLATIYDICPNWDGNTGDAKCGTTYSFSSNVWTATAKNNAGAFYVKTSSGDVPDTNSNWRDKTHCALCI